MKYYLTILFAFYAVIGFGQVLTINDATTGEPIDMVTLTSQDPRAHAITNAKGQVELDLFKGAERIDFHALGYKNVYYSYEELKSGNFRITMESSNVNLQEVVVSVSGWRQTSDNVPSRIISISPREVQLQNPQTTADLLGLSGEVFIQKSQQGGGSPMIRGFATNRLLYTVDGVRMNTAIFRGGNIQNVINLDPFAIENTEVLFGPGSVIYGSDAIGGVMSFQTLSPQLSLQNKPLVTGKALARFATASMEKTGHFDFNIGWKKWAALTSVSYWDYGDLKQGSNGPNDYLKPYRVERINGMDSVIIQDDELLQVPSAYSQLNLMQKVLYRPNKNWGFEYGFHYSETSEYGRYDRHMRSRNDLPRYGEWNYGPQSWMMNNLTINHDYAAGIYDELTLKLAQQSFKESRISRNFNDPMRETRTENVEAYSINLDLIKSVGNRNTIFYGVEYVTNDVQSTGVNENIETGVQSPGPSRYPQSDWNSVGVYINEETNVSEQFTVQLGMRFTQFWLDAEFDTTFYPFPFTSANVNKGTLTGSLGLVYRPSKTWVISTNFGTAFRSPNVDDIGKVFDSEPGAVTVPNPGLDAEYAISLDVGVAKVINEKIKIDANAFYTVLNDAMVRRNFAIGGMDSIIYDGVLSQVQALQNAAEAHIYGVQAGLEVKLPAGFSLSSDLSYQVGEEELDDGTTSPSRHAAPMFGVTRLTYIHNKLNLQIYSAYQGERSFEDLAVEERSKDEIYAKDKNGNNYSPAWYTLNIKGMYQFTPNLSLSLGLENITDQRYRPYSSGISAPGRNFIASVRADF